MWRVQFFFFTYRYPVYRNICWHDYYIPIKVSQHSWKNHLVINLVFLTDYIILSISLCQSFPYYCAEVGFRKWDSKGRSCVVAGLTKTYVIMYPRGTGSSPGCWISKPRALLMHHQVIDGSHPWDPYLHGRVDEIPGSRLPLRSALAIVSISLSLFYKKSSEKA